MRLLSDLSGRLKSEFLCILATTFALQPLPAIAQSFCGPTTLVNFNGINGQYPAAGVIFDAQGNMYGTTAQGGPSFNPLGSSAVSDGLGTVWKYSSAAGLTTLFAFSGAQTPANNGYHPETPLVMDAQGNLYGTTEFGGLDFTPDINNDFGLGTIFKLSPTGQFTEVHQFSGPDGANPVGMLIDGQANLVGTTSQGGLNWNPALGDFGLGTVFESAADGTFSNPVLFSSGNGGGAITGGLVTDGLGNFYGTTYEGGNQGRGSIFKYSAATGLTTLVNFTGTNGMLPSAPPILDGQGNLYGTALQGGVHFTPSNACCGTVWKYSTSTGVFTTLVSIDGDTVPADGMFPAGAVTMDSQGNLYGGTIMGGAFGDGIIYEYSSTGQLSTLVTFSGPNGWNPEGNLTFDSAGNLYGVTDQGGTSGYGTVFKLTPNPGGGVCGGVTLASLAFNPTTAQAGSTSQGTVTLTAPAPSGGAIVGLSTDNAFGLVPATTTVVAGAISGTFTFTAKPGVLSNTPVTVTASLGNSTIQATVTITPASTVFVSSLTLNPSTVSAGSNVNGTVTLNTAAPSGGAVVTLSSSNTGIATVPASVTVQSGKTSANFSGRTQKVTSNSSAVISGSFGGTTKTATLTVTGKN
jgi:uncharacterized repeat protein (TIGR03803 family)